MKKRVVITGAGIICSSGSSVPEFNAALLSGRSPQAAIPEERFPTTERVYRNRTGFVVDQDYYEQLRQRNEVVLPAFCFDIIDEAIASAGLDLEKIDRRKLGLSIGTSVGSSFVLLDWVKAFLKDTDAVLSLRTPATIAGEIKQKYGIRGPVSTISTACAAGTNSIGRAFDFIQSGRCTTVVTGGVDIFTDHSMSGFNILGAISRDKCRPFDTARDGIILGDGGAFFILEELETALARKAPVLAEILGYSTLNEAYHPTSPKPDGSMALRVMSEALRYSGVEASEIGFINAHGTGTAANDSMEWKAIKALFQGGQFYVSSIKSMLGHTLGAAGSVELLASVLGLRGGYIPPTVNVRETICTDGAGIELVRDEPVFVDYDYSISNSFGFAGNMAAIVVKKYTEHANQHLSIAGNVVAA
jgi:3-oxoacyl-[acyl-carrier-protein] synthase II